MHNSALMHRKAFYDICAAALKNALPAERKTQARVRAVRAPGKFPFSPNLELLTIMLGVPRLQHASRLLQLRKCFPVQLLLSAQRWMITGQISNKRRGSRMPPVSLPWERRQRESLRTLSLCRRCLSTQMVVFTGHHVVGTRPAQLKATDRAVVRALPFTVEVRTVAPVQALVKWPW